MLWLILTPRHHFSLDISAAVFTLAAIAMVQRCADDQWSGTEAEVGCRSETQLEDLVS